MMSQSEVFTSSSYLDHASAAQASKHPQQRHFERSHNDPSPPPQEAVQPASLDNIPLASPLPPRLNAISPLSAPTYLPAATSSTSGNRPSCPSCSKSQLSVKLCISRTNTTSHSNSAPRISSMHTHQDQFSLHLRHAFPSLSPNKTLS
eukprot:TRINITY_DN12219_c0_g1_i1.p2 TRINITY_DN12219_c0_g1~~TRINITY_DN12219_c0_g1_i1.p2  ORF type:complete len:148 (+),score=4.90 TRINITY_DN12219_c0_g1_i1:201-644(+)